MTLQRQILPISFADGIETKIDPKQVPLGKFLVLENGVFTGVSNFRKRWGYDLLGNGIIGGGSITSSVAISSFLDELLLFDGLQAYAYLPANDAWVNKGKSVSIITDNNQIIRNNGQQLSPDFASLNGVELYAWEDTRGGIRYSIVDSETETIIVKDKQLGSSSSYIRPKIIAFPASGVIALFWTDTSGNIYNTSINPSQPSLTPVINSIVSDGTSGGLYDVCLAHPTLTTTNLYLAYFNNTTHTVVVRIGTTLNPISSNVAGAQSSPTLINIAPNSGVNGSRDVLNIALVDGSSLMAYTMDSSTLALLHSATLTTASSIQSVASIQLDSSGDMATYYETAGAGGTTQFQVLNSITYSATLATLTGAAVLRRGVGLASKPFSYNGNVYLNTLFSSPLQATYFTMDSTGSIVGKISAGVAGPLIVSQDSMLPECPQISTGVFKFTNLVKGVLVSQNNTVFSLLGVNATSLDFEHSNQFLSVSINDGLYVVGAILQSYDGASFTEHGFHYYPEGFTASVSGSGGSLGSGSYQYVCTFEFIDNNGNTEYSAPSVALTATTSTSSSQVTLTIPTQKLTKKGQVRLGVYRTLVNQTLFYRVSSVTSPLLNNTTVDTLTFIDGQSDNAIQANELLYTTGGVLNNVAPAACSLIATYRDRIFIGGLEDKNSIQFTKPKALNVPMEFSAENTISIDPEGGEITAFTVLNGNFIIFKERSICYITGNGPDATGAQNDYDTPQDIASDVGCIEPNSICSGPFGVIFRAEKGIYLLDQSQNVSYIGAPVEGFNNLTITSVSLVPSQWVIFTTLQGTALVYDYLLNRWSTFTNHAAVDSDIFAAPDSVPYVFATAGGRVYQQNNNIFTDGGALVKMRCSTNWISLSGLQGYQLINAIYLLGDYKSTHTLKVSIAYDFEASDYGYTAINPSSVLGISTYGVSTPYGAEAVYGGGSNVYQFRIDLARRWCSNIKITIEDAQTSNFGEGYSISSILLELGITTSPTKLLPVRVFGNL